MADLPVGFTPDLPKDLPSGFKPDPHDIPEGFTPDAPAPKIATALDGIKDVASSLIAHATMAGHQALRRGSMAAIKATGPVSEEVETEFNHAEEADRLSEHLHKTALNMDIHPKDEAPELNPAITAMGPVAAKGLRAAQLAMDASDPDIIRAAQFGKMAQMPLADRITAHTANEGQHSPFDKAGIAPNPTPMEWGPSISKTADAVDKITKGVAAVIPALKMSGLTPSTMAYRRPGFASISNDDPSDMERGEEKAAGGLLRGLQKEARFDRGDPQTPAEASEQKQRQGMVGNVAQATADLINASLGSMTAGINHPRVRAAWARVGEFADSADAEELTDMVNTAMLLLGAGEGAKEVSENWGAAKDLPGWAAEAYVPDSMKPGLRAAYQDYLRAGVETTDLAVTGGPKFTENVFSVIPDETIFNFYKSLDPESQAAIRRSNRRVGNLIDEINDDAATGEGRFGHLKGKGAYGAGAANPFGGSVPTSAEAVADQTLAATASGPGQAELAKTYPSLYAVAAKGAPVPAAAGAQFGEVMGGLSKAVGNGPMGDMLARGHFQGKFSRIALSKLDESIRNAALHDAGAHPDTMGRHGADLNAAAGQPAKAASVIDAENKAQDAAVAARERNTKEVWAAAEKKKADLEAAAMPPEPTPANIENARRAALNAAEMKTWESHVEMAKKEGRPAPPMPDGMIKVYKDWTPDDAKVPPSAAAVESRIDAGAEPEQAIQEHVDAVEALKEVVPAVQTTTGEIIEGRPGEHHQDIIDRIEDPKEKAAAQKAKDEEGPALGFIKDGKFVGRDKMEAETGIRHPEELNDATGTDHPEVARIAADYAERLGQQVSPFHKKIAQAIIDHDAKTLEPYVVAAKDWNVESQKLFQKETGVKLPSTKTGKREALYKWAEEGGLTPAEKDIRRATDSAKTLAAGAVDLESRATYPGGQTIPPEKIQEFKEGAIRLAAHAEKLMRESGIIEGEVVEEPKAIESDPYSMEAIEAASGQAAAPGSAQPRSASGAPSGPGSSSTTIVERTPEEVKTSVDSWLEAESKARGLKNDEKFRVQYATWKHARVNAMQREMFAEMQSLPPDQRQAYLDAQDSGPRSIEAAELARRVSELIQAYPEVAAQIPLDPEGEKAVLKGFEKPAPAEWREGNYKSGGKQVRGIIAGGYVYGVKGGTVTHIPTGLRVTTEDTEAEAKAVAEALMNQVPELNDQKKTEVDDDILMKALKVRNSVRASLNPGKGLNSAAAGGTIPPDAAEATHVEPLGPESLLEIAGGQPAPVQINAEVGVPEGVPGVDGGVPGSSVRPAEGGPSEAGVPVGAGGDGGGEPRHGDLPAGAGRGDVAQEPGNFRITADTELEPDGKVARFTANVEAIKTLRAIEADGRLATPAEQAILARYVGWGQIPQAFQTYYGEATWQKRSKELQEFLTPDEYAAANHSTQNAHYTSRDVVGRIYKALDRIGFTGGRILEPAVGIGHFFGMLPDSMAGSRLVGVELDPITARIAKQLYQHADIRQMGFQEVKLPDGYFDGVMGNPPFSEVSPNDPKYNKFKYPLHDYFIVKSMDKLRDGGVMAIITSRYSMDKLNASWRDRVFERADLLGAVRLPDTAFKGNADTSVVTDILFFRKRLAGEPAGDATWLQSETKEGEGYSINKYFSDNPQMVVGEIGTKRGAYSANDFTVSHKGDFLPTLDAAIARLPQGVYSEAAAAPKEDALSKADAAAGVKKGGHVVRDGKVLQRKGDEMVEKKGADAARVSAMIDLLDTMNKTIASHQNEAGEAAVKERIGDLNKAYDKFVKKYGALNDRANKLALQDDPNLPKLLALENKSAAGFTKADIFEKPVIRASKKIDVMADPKDALNVVLNDVGRVDLKRIAALTSKTIEAVKADLKGLVYQNPDGGAYEIADVYLSGNVKQKLAAAQAAAAMSKDYADNVAALESVQPKDLEAHEITANLGAPWIPAETIAQFVDHLTGVHRSVKVSYMPLIGRWSFEQSHMARGLSYSVGNSSTWGTARMPAVDIVKSLLDGKQPTIYDGSGDNKVVNQPETDAARQKMEEVEEKFKSWIFEDKERRDQLLKLYNDTQNTHRVVKFNGAHLTMPGSNPEWKWRPHQLDAVWRAIISKNNMGLFHEVGTGKTGVMAGIAMESRRLGIAKKPMIAALNANVGSIIKDFRHIYPGAKILTFEAGDLSPATRGEFMSRIATGDWDAVIVTHPSFGKLPMSRDAQLEFYRKQVVEITGAMEQARMAEGKSSRMVKDLAKAADRIETKMEKLGEKLAKDETITFEELGVDMLIVDESQEFKNLYFPTTIARGVKGLGSGSDTGRSFDMYMKTQHISKLNNGRGVVFATGTPITNSMSEVYTLQRYLASDELHAEGLNHFDAWARTYGKIVNSFELKPSGKGYRVVQRFAKFQNVSELMRRYLQFADIVRSDTTGIKLPKKVDGKTRLVVVPASAMQKALIESLVKRYESLKPGGTDNALLITTDGRKAALDMRLIDKSLPDDPGSKLNKAVDIAFGNWQKGKEKRLTQAIFCDLGVPGEDEKFNVYGDIKSKLIDRGVPKEEIAFIHDAKTDSDRQALFAKVNAGKVRVIIGSRTKMGIGANFQRLLANSMSVDIPWRPDQIEQMEGRSIRQGNLNEEVGMDQLATENTFDTYIFSLLEGKAAGFAPVVRGDYNLREVDDLSGAALSFQEAKAASSGNPMVVEKIKIGGEIRKLNSLSIAHQKAIVAAQSEMAMLPQESEALGRKIEKLKADAEMSQKHSKSFAMTVGDKNLTERKDAGEAILAAVNGAIATGSVQRLDLGTYRGFLLVSPATERGNIHIIGKEYHLAKVADTAIGTIASIDSAINPDKLAGRAEEVEKNVVAMKKRIAELAGEVNKPFKFADKLRELKEREKVIDKELGANESDKGVGDPGAEDSGEDDGAPEGDMMFPEDTAKEDRGPLADRAPARPAEGLPEKGVYDDLSKPGAYEALVSSTGTEFPIEGPEILKLYVSISGKYPKVMKNMGDKRGAFYPGTEEIKMAAATFADHDQAVRTFAHELGHYVAMLDAVIGEGEMRTMKRGNLIGQLVSLHRYLKNSFPDGMEGPNNREMRTELISASKFWRPWDRDAAEPKEIKYRDSSKELFADALSMFMVSPGKLEAMAPKFYAALLDHMDEKPDFKACWLDIQDLLMGESDEVLEARERDIRDWSTSMKDLLMKRESMKGKILQSWGARAEQEMVNRYAPIMRAANVAEARGESVPDEFNPKYIYQVGQMAPEKILAFRLEIDSIVNPLFKNFGVTTEDTHVYGFYSRIQFDRSDLGNPGFHDPKTSKAGLDYLKRKFRDEKFEAMVEAQAKIQDVRWKHLEEARRLGVIGREVWDTKVVPNKGNHVHYAVLEYLATKGYISGTPKQQVGTLKPVGDTFIATNMQIEDLIHKNLDQRMKLTTKYWLDKEFPGSMTKTEIVVTPSGDRFERPGMVPGTTTKKGIVRLWDDGRRVPYDVDPYIAEMHEKMPPAHMEAVHRILNPVSSTMRLMVTSWNPGYALVTAPVRYARKTWKGLSDLHGGRGVSLASLLAEYVRSLPTAYSYAIGDPNAFARKLLNDDILEAISVNEMDMDPALNSFANKFKRFQLTQEGESDRGLWKRVLSKLMWPLTQYTHAMQIANDTQLNGWKVAAATLRMRAGQSGPSMSFHVRECAGMPFTRTKGLSLARMTNDWMWFVNAGIRHYTTAAAVLSDPKTGPGARMKTAYSDILPALIGVAAASGALGIALKAFYDRVPENDKRQGTVIPLGYIKGGKYGWKAVYTVIPHDDMGRLAHSIAYDTFTMIHDKDPREFANILGDLWNVIPSLSPTVEIPRGIAQEYTGGRAFDTFRKHQVISDAVEKVGGITKITKVVEWTTNSTGLTGFTTYDPGMKTTTETWIQGTPWLNRVVRVSDYGMFEKFKKQMDNTPGAEEIYKLHEKKNGQAGILSPTDHMRLAHLERAARIYHKSVKKEARQEQAPKSELRAAARAKIAAEESAK